MRLRAIRSPRSSHPVAGASTEGADNRGVHSMCDYSLQHIASRPAKVGDQLVTTRFTRSVTGGFAAVGEPNVAVCLLPGTELAFDNEIEAEAAFRVLPPKRQGASVARFRRINEDQPNMHHDALELPGGKVV